MSEKVLIWFESFYGAGHGSVVSQLSQELCKQGLQPVIVCSDTTQRSCENFNFGQEAIFVPLEGVEIQSGTEIKLTKRGKKPRDDEEWKENRKNTLLAALEEHHPKMILTEMYPFSRGSHDFELLPLIETAKQMTPPPLMASLCRDIMLMNYAPAVGGTNVKDFVQKNYDKVFVRGDSKVIRLEETCEVAREIGDMIDYQGYFVNKLPERTTSQENGNVLVSTGGAWLKQYLDIYNTAIEAKGSTPFEQNHWKFFISKSCPEEIFNDIKARAAEKGIEVIHNSPTFREELANATFAISACGYNTVCETASAGIPFVVIPLKDATREQGEQELRADKYKKMGYCEVVPSNELNTENLLAAMTRIAENHQTAMLDHVLNGAENTACQICAMIKGKLYSFTRKLSFSGPEQPLPDFS